MRKFAALFMAAGLAVMASGLAHAQDTPEARYRIVGTETGPNTAAAPLYTSPATGVVADVNVSEIGGDAFAQGARAIANSMSFTQATADVWDVDVLTLPVSYALDATDATTLRTVTATDSPDVTALQVIDDWDETNRAAVNTIAGQIGIAGGDGAQDDLTTRTVTATDSPEIPLLTGIDGDTNTIAGTVAGSEQQVDIVAPLPAGTNSIGVVDTELPAAVALSNALPNPTVPGVGSYLLGWDEAPTSEWERLLSVGGYLQIDIARMAGAQFAFGQTTEGASIPVVLASDQFPLSVVLADDIANPTLSRISTYGMLYDGTTWDRAPGNSVGGAYVQGETAVGAVPTVGANPVGVSGVDAAGGVARRLLTDTSGRLRMVGAAASGAAEDGDPVLVGGTSGGNVYTLHTDATGDAQVDLASAIPAGAATIGKVDIELAGVAADTDQGLAGAGTQRVKEAQPGDNEDGIIDVAQGAACAATYAIPVDAYQTTCQNQDDADYIRVRAVDTADTDTGFIMAPQSAGAGQTYTTELRGVSLCFFNDTQAAIAKVYCASDTAPAP